MAKKKKIVYQDKIKDNPNVVNGKWTHNDANEVKEVVNNISDDVDALARIAHTHNNKNLLDAIDQNVNTTASPTFENVTANIEVNTKILNADNQVNTDTVNAHSNVNTDVLNATTSVNTDEVRANVARIGEQSSNTFVTGFAGNGYRLSKDANQNYHLELDRLTVRKDFTVYELIVSQIRATNGSLWVSDAIKIESATLVNGNYRCTIDTDGDTIYIPFVVDDIIRCQRFNGKSLKYYTAKVVAVNSVDKHFTLQVIEGSSAPEAKDDLVRVGNATNIARQGAVYLTSSDNGAPYIDVIDGVTSASFADKTKVRMGKLNGIVDPNFGALTGYGIYANNAYIKGKLIVQAGSNVYTKTENDSNISTAKTEAIASAKTYTDSQATTTYNNAKTYADQEIAELRQSVTDLETEIEGVFADGIISEAEAISIEKYKNVLSRQKLDIDNQYTLVYANTNLTGTAKTNLATAKTNLNTSYTSLLSAINTAIQDGKATATEKTAVDTAFADFNTKNATYTTRLTEALEAIENKKNSDLNTALKSYSDAQDNAKEVLIKAYTDGVVDAEEARAIADAEAKLLEAQNFAVSKAQEAITTATNDAKAYTDAEIIEINSVINDLETTVNTTFADGIIEKSEKVAIEKYLNTVSVEKLQFDNQYSIVYANTNLTGTAKTNLATAKTNYNNTHTALVNAINTAIQDGKTTATEKQAVDTAFTNYRTNLGVLATRLQEALNAIEIKANTDLSASNKAYSDVQDNLKETLIKAYSDGKITAEEQRAIADATAKLNEAKADATAKANQAKQQAIDASAIDATNKANQAQANAIASANQFATNSLNDLKIGGRNLILGSNKVYSNVLTTGREYDNPLVKYGFDLAVNEQKNFIFSFDLEMVYVTENPKIQVYTTGYQGNIIPVGQKAIYLTSYVPASERGKTVKVRVSTPITLKGVEGDSANNRISFYSVYDTGDRFKLSNFKLEIGNKATDYTPAPEDIENALEVVKTSTTTQFQVLDNKIEGKVSQTDYNALNQRVGSAESNITQQANQIASKVSQTSFDTLNNTVGGLTGRISNAEASITQQADAIALRATKSELTTTVSTAKSEAISTASSDATTKANNAQTNAINTASTDATNKANTAQTNAVASAKTYTDSQITIVNDAITLKSDKSVTDGLTSRMASAEAKITPDAIKLTVKSQTETIANTAANNVQIGGRNLILNSANIIQSGNDKNNSNNSVKGVITVNNNNNQWNSWVFPQLSTGFKIGEEVVYSVEVKSDKAFDLYTNFMPHYPSNNFNSTVSLTANVWTKIIIKGVISNVTNASHLVGFQGSNSPSAVFNYRNFKIEKGNKATDWTPAPEDIEGKVDTLTTRVTNAETSINQTASDITLLAKKSDVTTEINTAITNINVGGRNLIPNSGNFKNTNGYSGFTLVQKDGFSTLHSANGGSPKLTDWVILKPNTEYVYSGRIMLGAAFSATALTPLHSWCAKNTGNNNSGFSGTVTSNWTGKVIPANTWVDVVVKFKTTTGTSTDTFKFTPILYTGLTTPMWLQYWQLEEGNTVTNWTPAPEDIDSKVDTLTTRVTNAEASINLANDAINLRATKSELTTTVSTAKSEAISTASTDATTKANNARTSAVSTASTDATTKANNAQTNAVASAKTYTDSQITIVNNAITLKSDKTVTDGLTNRMASAEAKITPDAIKLTVKSQTEDITNTAVNNVQVGGRNLFKETKSEWTTVILPSSEYFIQFGSDIKIEYNTEYTFAIEVEKVSNDSVPINLHLGLSSVIGGYTWDFPSWRKNGIEMGKKTILTYKVLPTDGGSGTHTFFAFRLRNERQSTTIRYRFVKLEKGNKATDWSPAPEDVDAEIAKRPTESEIKAGISIQSNAIRVFGQDISLAGKVTFSSLDTSAQTTINTASSNASTALSTAGTANSNASTALSTANTANGNASTALSTANTANSNAGTANSNASTALSTANTANSTANTANSNASTALNTANTANSTANTALLQTSIVDMGGGQKKVLNPVGFSGGDNATGAILINTPIMSAYMFTMKITGYLYLSNSQTDIDLTITGYAYTNTQILNHNYTSHGSYTPSIQLGRDSVGRLVIKLGDVTNASANPPTVATVWKYPKLSVDFCFLSHSTAPNTYKDGWTMTQVTTLPTLFGVVTPSGVKTRETINNWTFANTTEIDGAKIKTGTLTADKVNTLNLTARHIATSDNINKMTINEAGDNSIKIRHSNGQVALIMGLVDGVPKLVFYNEYGNKVWEAGMSGYVFVDNIPESWSPAMFKLLPGNHSNVVPDVNGNITSSEKAQLKNWISTSSGFLTTDFGGNPVVSYGTTYYSYSAGINAQAVNNRVYEGLHTSQVKATNNWMPNGWYGQSETMLFQVSEYPVKVYSITLEYYFNGKMLTSILIDDITII